MRIKKIELHDIKSHVHSTFEFEPGTTAITGANGAGKTTIIEAIAWTLFDLLDYKKDDFVRRGQRKGSVRLTFISGLDEREYIVYRDTLTGYYVFDPALGLRIAEKKEEVCRFLCLHLGVEPGTNLESLFRRAIGVPQGTFTAIFLEGPAERKKAFDKLLKVEEYRRGSDELIKTSRYLDQEISTAMVNAARAEGELARWDAIRHEYDEVSAKVRSLNEISSRTAEKIEAKSTAVNAHAENGRKLTEAKAECDTLRTRHSEARLTLGHLEHDLKQARDAVEKVERVRADSALHEASLGRLKELERERGVREELRLECSKIETALATVRAELAVERGKLESALAAHSTIETLRPLCVEQERLEKLVESLRERATKASGIKRQIESLSRKRDTLRAQYRDNKTLLDEAQAKARAAGDVDGLQRRDADLVRELARLQADLERDEKFQNEIKNGLCPILSEKCLNLGSGQTLEGFVTSQFTEVRSKIASLRVESEKVGAELRTSREAESFAARFDAYRAREAELAVEGADLNSEIEALEAELKELSVTDGELEKAVAELNALGDPRGRIKLLESEVLREPEIRQCISKIESNIERLESDRRINVEKLESYKDLDQLLAEAAAARDRTAEAHRTFLANAELAGSIGAKEAEWTKANAEMTALADALTAAVRQLEDAERSYDREGHSAASAELIALQNKQIETQAHLEAARNREQILCSEIDRLSERRVALQLELQERERLEKVREATEFIRSTLKEAAPRVARNYVFLVSVEANQLFREIAGDAECTLKWGEDYGISLEEGGYDRPFVNLSGGEQMAAALAVRLALLKQLSDVRIAFFDEPTTNMDAERRENLAIQISQIKHFDQLFVISHDDTFESYVDNHIRVGDQ
jgi:exonuclease SbcC